MRQIPHAIEIEKHVIGAAILSPEVMAMIVEKLQEEDFWAPRHEVIFAAMRDFLPRGLTLDIAGLQRLLTASGMLVHAGGEEYLTEISSEVVSTAGTEHHIQILKEHASRRKLIKTLGENLESAYDLSKAFREVQDKAEADILAVGESASVGPKLKSMDSVLRVATQEWQDVVNGKPGGLLSKIGPVDELLGGFKPGKIYILAARPGLGKSMMALQTATQCGQPVATYSMEMLATEQAERMISQESDLNSDSLRSSNIMLAKRVELAQAVTRLRGLPIWFCDESPITPAQILSQCRRLKKKHGLGLIVVDYLQLIKGVGKFERRDLEVGHISKFLKSIAMKLEVPVITIASLSRRPEERTDKRPLLSDLRESGDIESDADCVMFLYRESDYNNEAKKFFPNVTEIIVAKNRGGKKGRALANFDGAHSKFYGLDIPSAKSYFDFIEKKGSHDQKAPYTGNPKQVSDTHSDFFPRH